MTTGQNSSDAELRVHCIDLAIRAMGRVDMEPEWVLLRAQTLYDWVVRSNEPKVPTVTYRATFPMGWK